MPQGRRKVPFSGKAKKEQLKAKRQTKQGPNRSDILLKSSENNDEGTSVQKINFQPSKDGKSKPNRYALQFFKESKEQLAKQRELARQSLEPKSEKDLEVNGDDYFVKELEFPRRPPWSYDLTKEQLESKEQKYFHEYLKSIEEKFDWKDLSVFELNLETWRQLWRVLEMSDVILFIVDIRFAALMFPPSLYDYVVNTLKKDFILVLNKIDLAPASIVVAWKAYFQEKYPELHIVMFTTLPGYNLVGKQSDSGGLQVRRKRGRIRMAAEGTQQLFEVCKQLVGNEVDLTSWENKIKEEMNVEIDSDEQVEIEETHQLKSIDTQYYEYERYSKGVLTVGCIGQPNVGKSSLMNAIMGKKVVSVSKTPGHTKHFQTIFLTRNVRLCDCPGLVFPSKVPKTLQVLMGSFPIAQLRDPYTTVKYLAERLDLVKLLRIDHPTNDDTWSAMDICDGWAKKRRFYTAKAARLDTYRAANNILRMALDGKICLCHRPPSYSEKKDYWSTHPEIKLVQWIQARSSDESGPQNFTLSDFSDESDEDSAVSKQKQIKDAKSDDDADENDDDEEDGEDDEEEDSEEELPCARNKFAALQDED